MVGNVLSEQDALGHQTTYAYDNLYRVTGETDANGDTVGFGYNAAGKMTSLTDPELNTTKWQYDILGRMTSETNELGDSRLFEYDYVGNLLEATDRNGRVVEYDYDDLYRLTQERWLDEQLATVRTMDFQYDAASRMTNASDPAAMYLYTYDALDRVTQETQNLGQVAVDVVLAHQYDARSSRTGLSATIDGVADFTNQYTFDNIERMTQSGQAGGNAVAEKRVDLAYDAEGKWQSITRYVGSCAILLCLFYGCGRPMTIPGHEQRGITSYSPQIGIMPVEAKYLTEDKDFTGRFDNDERWYVRIEYNVRSNDRRSDSELLEECFRESRTHYQEEMEQLIRSTGGTVDYIEMVIYRDEPHKVGKYPLGLLVPLGKFRNPAIPSDVLFGSCELFENPVVIGDSGWVHVMALAHAQAELGLEKQ